MRITVGVVPTRGIDSSASCHKCLLGVESSCDDWTMLSSYAFMNPVQSMLWHGCRLQEVNKSWIESPFIRDNRDALSKEVVDLLNQIFVVDPQKRITIPQLMKHPW